MATVTATDETLQRIWQAPAGFIRFFTAVNHRNVGARYVVTGLVFFALAGIAALLMRIQLMFPNNTFLDPELYNQIFTMHGTTMMFLFAVPIMEGVGIYLVPLMIGTRDMAFPRMNAFGYFVYLISGVVLWGSLFFGVAPRDGWFAYTPLAGPEYSPGLGMDFYTTLITFLELAALVAAVELIVTIFKLRAPGMSFNRIPLFVWSILVMAFMIVFAMPPLIVASLELAFDRTVGTHFFNPRAGGDPLLWQHLFWFFGHPEVYIILIPGLGMVASVLPTFTRRPMVGYPFLVLAFVAIGIISFALWVHHMFATGLPILGLSFFTIASMSIAIPSGIQIFSSLATLWYGRIVMSTSLRYVLGFIFIFVLGGITGVMVSAIPFDLQVHDTYFVVAHFHYVLLGGAVFPLFAGMFYWFPKLTGRMLDERWGRWQFWITFIGFNVTFFPMHFLGFLGMPRRVYTFQASPGLELWNLVSSLGAFVLVFGILIFFIMAFRALRTGKEAGNNPWDAGTLEWATTSPPAPYNFATIPVVHSRHPLWDERTDWETFSVSTDRRETLGTTVISAVPEQRVVLPGPTIIPFLAALAVAFTFVALMIDLWLVPVGAVLTVIALVAWNWPNKKEQDIDWATAGPEGALPVSTIISSKGSQPPFWWGMILLIIIEAVVFASLISSYFYLRAGAEVWPLDYIDPPDLLLPIIGTVVLLLSSIPIYYADRGIQKGDQRRQKIGLAIGFVLGLIFLVIKVIEYSGKTYDWSTNAYGSIVWVIIGYHAVHVLALLIKTAVVGVLAFRDYFDEERNAAMQVNGLYWHFVVIVWIPLFLTLYIAPHVLGAD